MVLSGVGLASLPSRKMVVYGPRLSREHQRRPVHSGRSRKKYTSPRAWGPSPYIGNVANSSRWPSSVPRELASEMIYMNALDPRVAIWILNLSVFQDNKKEELDDKRHFPKSSAYGKGQWYIQKSLAFDSPLAPEGWGNAPLGCGSETSIRKLQLYAFHFDGLKAIQNKI